ncbi:MAG: tyrosine-type recombinase/integrase [Nitrospinae bacterium]|nr:tyrosine-type recombinase/integrase [Nitrospinota bacterium]
MNDLVPHPLLEQTKLFDAAQARMKLRQYSDETIKAYMGQLRAFLRGLGPRDARAVSMEEMRGYLLGLIETGRSRSAVDQAVNALRFLCEEVFRQPFSLGDFSRPRKNRDLPSVLSVEEVKRIAVSAENPKHRLMIELAFSAGLRVSELVEVRVKHLNMNKSMLFVPGLGKGRKGRITIFSESLKDALARQTGLKRPDDFLFPSERGGKLTTRSVAKFFKAALEVSGVGKGATPHSLRHSFAAFLARNGTDLPTLQNLLGHNRPESAKVYSKIAQRS